MLIDCIICSSSYTHPLSIVQPESPVSHALDYQILWLKLVDSTIKYKDKTTHPTFIIFVLK